MVNRMVAVEIDSSGHKVNPFTYIAAFARYPGWFEIIAGIGGGLGWTILSLFSNAGMAERPVYAFTVFAFPGAWEVLGVTLASVHAYGLASKRPRWRAWAMFSTTAFWCNITFGFIASQLLLGKPFPGMAIASGLLGIISFIVTVRLWKRYQ